MCDKAFASVVKNRVICVPFRVIKSDKSEYTAWTAYAEESFIFERRAIGRYPFLVGNGIILGLRQERNAGDSNESAVRFPISLWNSRRSNLCSWDQADASMVRYTPGRDISLVYKEDIPPMPGKRVQLWAWWGLYRGCTILQHPLRIYHISQVTNL